MSQPVRRTRRTVVILTLLSILIAATGYGVYDHFWGNNPKPTAARPDAKPQTDDIDTTDITPEQRDNREASRAIADNPTHFKCKEYPRGGKLRRADVVPTGNIVVVIEFDKSSGTYKVAQNDQRVYIKHTVENKISHERRTPQPYTDDKFTWKFTDDTLPYGTYKEYRGGKGMTWSSGDVYTGKDNMILANRSNGTDNPRYVIIGTDPATCSAYNKAPAGMWDRLISSGLNLPQFTS